MELELRSEPLAETGESRVRVRIRARIVVADEDVAAAELGGA